MGVPRSAQATGRARPGKNSAKQKTKNVSALGIVLYNVLYRVLFFTTYTECFFFG
jgi:hypothetical protein